MADVVIEPGTPFFGLAYDDGSCGCWQRDREAVKGIANEWAELGMPKPALLKVRMKSSRLFASE